jgi:hypothetical protein
MHRETNQPQTYRSHHLSSRQKQSHSGAPFPFKTGAWYLPVQGTGHAAGLGLSLSPPMEAVCPRPRVVSGQGAPDPFSKVKVTGLPGWSLQSAACWAVLSCRQFCSSIPVTQHRT